MFNKTIKFCGHFCIRILIVSNRLIASSKYIIFKTVNNTVIYFIHNKIYLI